MEQIAVLGMGLDPSGVEQGAQRAKAALAEASDGAAQLAEKLDEVGTASNDAGTEINDASREIEHLHGVVADLRERMKSLRKDFDTFKLNADAVGKSMFSMGGIAAEVGNKFTKLSRAAVGFAAVDLVAKVIGFSSAMDLLGKTVDALADGIREVLGINAWARMLEEEKKRAEEAAAAWAKLLDVRLEAQRAMHPDMWNGALMGGVVHSDVGLATGFRKYRIGELPDRQVNADLSGLSYDSRILAVNMLEGMKQRWEGMPDKLRSEYESRSWDKELGIVEGTQSITKKLIDGFDESMQDVLDRIEELRAQDAVYRRMPGGKLEGLQVEGGGKPMSGAAMQLYMRRKMGGSWTPAMGGRMPTIEGLGITEGNQPKYGYDFSAISEQMFAAQAAQRERERASAAADRAARNARFRDAYYGEGGFYGRARSAALGYANTSAAIEEDDARERSDRLARLRDKAERSGAYQRGLDTRFGAESLSEDFASNFYGQLRYSLLTLDFSDFGRSVASLIQQSLVDALIASPIQSAVKNAMQALLGGLTQGAGALGGGVSRGAYGGWSMVGADGNFKTQVAGRGQALVDGSTALSGGRSTRQRFDDSRRGRVR